MGFPCRRSASSPGRRFHAALGDAKRFNAVLAEYKMAKDVTRKRLYLETMETILPNMEKIIVEEGLPAPLPLLEMGRKAIERAEVK